MKAELLIPAVMILIAGVSLIFAQNKPADNQLQNEKSQNDAIQEFITHPQMMQNFVHQLSNNPEAMNNMIGYIMQNKNARRMLMNDMFSVAKQDSSFTNYM